MPTAGSSITNSPAGSTRPHWLLAELTYACPLQCPYCSNPLGYDGYRRDELDTEGWLRVLRQARAMGAVQLGFSGGEPLVRRDLEVLVAEGARLGYYSNLITSGIGLTDERIAAFREAGLDHIQLSIQASDREVNDYIAGTECFDEKLEAARRIKRHGYPMVLCFVLHRYNIDAMEAIIQTAVELEADYVELATAQYHGWALANRTQLLPTREQLERAEAIAHDYQKRLAGKMKLYYVVPDYYEGRPKACMNGWGNIFLTVAPDGTALPCHSARDLPGLDFPNVRDQDLESIWYRSEAFNHFRGDSWMKAPCRTCPEKEKDFGGCRCQAYMLTGDAANADPTCALSPHHHLVEAARARADQTGTGQPLIFRNPRSAKALDTRKVPA